MSGRVFHWLRDRPQEAPLNCIRGAEVFSELTLSLIRLVQ